MRCPDGARKSFTAAAISAAGLLLGGCGIGARPSQPLAPELFVVNSQAANSNLGNPLDRPGQIPYDSDRVVQQRPVAPAEPPPVTIGKTVRESVRTPDAEARINAEKLGFSSTEPAAPATRPSSDASAQGSAGYYGVVGCVLMVVDSTAIFSDKILAEIDKPLRAEAKKRGEASFREISARLFENQLQVAQREELEFATAQRNLGPEDEQIARGLTIQWRQKKITEAGGSLELARRKASQDGWDFDKLVEQQFRLHMAQIYYQRRVIPLINVTASDIRNYYDQHKEADFTTHGQAKFRVIKIDPNKHGQDREEALRIARDALRLAQTDDFAEVAKSTNDDPGYRARSGAVGGADGFVQRGGFVYKEVEEAVCKLQPGQITDIINSEGLFFIAKLEALSQDKVKDFDDLDLQEQIRDRLRGQQFNELREKTVNDLLRQSVTSREDKMIRQTLESIWGRYAIWSAPDSGVGSVSQ